MTRVLVDQLQQPLHRLRDLTAAHPIGGLFPDWTGNSVWFRAYFLAWLPVYVALVVLGVSRDWRGHLRSRPGVADRCATSRQSRSDDTGEGAL